MIKDQMMSRLSEEPALAGLDERDMLEMLKVMEEVVLPTQKVLTWEDTPVQEFGVILDGAMAVFVGATKRQILGAGDRFGVTELSGDKCWRHTLVTECDTRVLVADKAHLLPLIGANSNIAAVLGLPRVETPAPRRVFGRSMLRRPRVAIAG